MQHPGEVLRLTREQTDEKTSRFARAANRRSTLRAARRKACARYAIHARSLVTVGENAQILRRRLRGLRG